METDLVSRAHRTMLLALGLLLALVLGPGAARADDTATPAVDIPATAVQPANAGGAATPTAAATTINVTIVNNSPGAVVNTAASATAAVVATAPSQPVRVDPPAPPQVDPPAPPVPAAVAVPKPPAPPKVDPPDVSAATGAPQLTTSSPDGAASSASGPASAPAPSTATPPQPASAAQGDGGGASRVGGLAAERAAHAPRAAQRRHDAGARVAVRLIGQGAASAAWPVAPVPAPPAAGITANAHGGETASARDDASAARHHTRATRAPHRAPALPIEPPAAASAGGLGGPSGGTMLAIALVAALLLSGSAGPYELVALLRRRVPQVAGGRLERPG